MILRRGQSCDDVFQQVVLKALEDTSHFADEKHLLYWAIRLARHRAVDLVRADRRVLLDDSVYELLEAEIAETPSEQIAGRLAALQSCLEQISAVNRQMLRLRYVDGLLCDLIARQLNRSIDAVYQNLSRLHRKLRECIEQRIHASAASHDTGLRKAAV